MWLWTCYIFNECKNPSTMHRYFHEREINFCNVKFGRINELFLETNTNNCDLIVSTKTTISSILIYKYPRVVPFIWSLLVIGQSVASCPKCPQQGPEWCLLFLEISTPTLGCLSFSFARVIGSSGFSIVKLPIPPESSTSGKIRESGGQLYALSPCVCVGRSLICDNTMEIRSQATSRRSSVSTDSAISVEAMDSSNWIFSECILEVEDELTHCHRVGR